VVRKPAMSLGSLGIIKHWTSVGMSIGFLGSKLPQRSTKFKKVLFYLLISTHGEVNSYLLVLLFFNL
jgi:hypothetical protein